MPHTEAKGEGNGNPLQYSCLENPVDGGLLSIGLHRVGHNKSDLPAAAAAGYQDQERKNNKNSSPHMIISGCKSLWKFGMIQ